MEENDVKIFEPPKLDDESESGDIDIDNDDALDFFNMTYYVIPIDLKNIKSINDELIEKIVFKDDM